MTYGKKTKVHRPITDFVGYRPMTAFVGFGGSNSVWWTRFLKKGYRHCLVVLACKNNVFLLIDPILKQIDYVVCEDEKIIDYIKGMGYKFIKTEIKQEVKDKPHIFVPFTCVEVVKRVLGITSFWIVTPYQLFKYIKKEKK